MTQHTDRVTAFLDDIWEVCQDHGLCIEPPVSYELYITNISAEGRAYIFDAVDVSDDPDNEAL